MEKGRLKHGNDPLEDGSEYNDEYSHLSKSTLVQESKCFNDNQLKEKVCVDILNKIIYLLNQGQTFMPQDSTGLFFNATKLLQNSNQKMRRLLYVFFKELKVSENEVFIVVSSLIKDVQQSENEMYKANALRVLSKIIDDSYIQTFERFLKQAIIDKSHHVVSSSIVSLHTLYHRGGHCTDIVKKMVNELWDKLFNSGNGDIQYQALQLLYEIKKNDQMALIKLLSTLAQSKMHNSITKCQLIRYIKITLVKNQQIDSRSWAVIKAYLDQAVQKEEDSVQFEAAKCLCDLQEVLGSQAIDIEAPFSVLTMLASNTTKPVNKYAALRVMNKVASKQPNLVGICQTELESLITDQNRSIASLAISTLLKTCNEDSVQKLLKQISHYLPDLGLDFKIEVIYSTKLLYKRVPQKADTLLKFLTDCLKEQGDIKYREAIIDTIMEICPTNRERALQILAEHIEDCDKVKLQTKILYFLAQEGPKSKQPQTYIRFIYNRVNLEKTVIRAAAVTSLATFAYKVPALRYNIMLLLRKCLDDSDDEVRERTLLYLKMLEDVGDNSLAQHLEIEFESGEDIDAEDKEALREFVFDDNQDIDVDALEAYIGQERDRLIEDDQPIYIDSSKLVLVRPKKQTVQENDDDYVQEEQNLPALVETESEWVSEMKKCEKLMPIIEAETLHFSSQPISVNDSHAEYQVSVVKHFFDHHIILQYSITNTIEDHRLSNVRIKIGGLESQQALKIIGSIELGEEQTISYGEDRYVYVIVSKSEADMQFPTATIKQKFLIQIAEIDVDSKDELGSYEEDYKIEDVTIAVRDYISPQVIPSGQMKDLWDAMGANPKCSDAVSSYQIQFKTMEDAVKGVISQFGMSVCEGTDKVNVTEKTHNLLMSGRFQGEESILVRGQLGFNQQYGCVLKVQVRSLNELVSNLVLECIQ